MNLGVFWLIHTFTPSWMHDRTPDKHHFYRRKFTRQYQQRKRWLTKLWAGVGLMCLAIPIAPLVVAVLLLTAFVSFSVLDESQDK